MSYFFFLYIPQQARQKNRVFCKKKNRLCIRRTHDVISGISSGNCTNKKKQLVALLYLPYNAFRDCSLERVKAHVVFFGFRVSYWYEACWNKGYCTLFCQFVSDWRGRTAGPVFFLPVYFLLTGVLHLFLPICFWLKGGTAPVFLTNLFLADGGTVPFLASLFLTDGGTVPFSFFFWLTGVQ